MRKIFNIILWSLRRNQTIKDLCDVSKIMLKLILQALACEHRTMTKRSPDFMRGKRSAIFLMYLTRGDVWATKYLNLCNIHLFP